MAYNSGKLRPWEDGGDEVIIDTIVPCDALRHPFEVYFYFPRPGYGHLKFNAENIQLQYRKANRDTGLVYWAGDLDGDADFDANDVGCLIAVLLSLGLGYLIKKTSDDSRKDEFGIIWALKLDYDQIQSIEVKGRTLEITTNDRRTRKFTLRTAEVDGERLYRELSYHFPKALYS